MRLSTDHRQLLEVSLAAGEPHGLVLAGGYALQAHGLVERPSRSLAFATERNRPLPSIAALLADAYREAGFGARVIEASPRMARLEVSILGSDYEVDLLKEALGPPVWTDLGPVLSLEDAVGLKVRALHDRGLARDFIDVHAARERFSWPELETAGRRHDEDFSLQELSDRLAGVEYVSDGEFAAYGLDDVQIAELRSWALAWLDDIAERLVEGVLDEDDA
jgi:hypothetical protein